MRLLSALTFAQQAKQQAEQKKLIFVYTVLSISPRRNQTAMKGLLDPEFEEKLRVK